MGKLGDREWNALRPDAQAFDEVRIVTVPRYKESELSGDEWRISAETQFYRKGKLIHSTGRRNVETACGFAYADYLTAIDDGKGNFGGDGKTCDQEGCAEPATVKYRMKAAYDRSGAKQELTMATFRHFCERHKRRGDCGLDDADENYEQVPFTVAAA